MRVFATAGEFLSAAAISPPACVVLDVHLPDLHGLEVQARLPRSVPIVFITGRGDIPMSVMAIRSGAIDFLTKPFDVQHLLKIVRQACATSAPTSLTKIVGESASLGRVLDQVRTVAATSPTVLIQGETGTGKELIASAVHESSARNAPTDASG